MPGRSTSNGGTDSSPPVEFWLDEVATRLGFGWLADHLPVTLPPSYAYAVIAVSVPVTLGTAYDWFVLGGESLIYFTNPYFLLQPVLLLGAVYGARTLRYDYARAMDEMAITERGSDGEALLTLVPERLPWALFVVAVVVQFLPGMKNTAGWVVTDYLFNYLVFPFVYTPIAVQFLAVYVSIEFLAPWRLSRSDVGIDFLDPQGVGGLRPLGELIKKAYYFIVAGLIGYALITYAPLVDSGWTVTAGANALYTTVWVLTVGTIAFAVFVLHRFMHREKRNEIQRLEAELRGHIDNPWDVKRYEIPEGKQDVVDDLRERITRVSETNE